MRTLVDVQGALRAYVTRVEAAAKPLDLAFDTSALLEESANEQLLVAFVGEFSGGKSSLINALIREKDLLPVQVTPTTAKITTVRPGSAFTCALIDAHGRREVVDRQAFQRFAVGDGSHPQAVSAELTVPRAFLGGDVAFADTPGISSLEETHADITYGFLPTADAVVLVMDSFSRPLTESVVEFIRTQLFDRVRQRLIVVLAKADSRPAAEVEKQLGEVSSRLVPLGLPADRIVTASALDAGLLEGCEHRLRRFLSDERVGLVAQRMVSKLSAKVEGLRIQAEIVKQKSTMNDEERAHLDAKLRQARDELRASRTKAMNDVRAQTEALIPKYQAFIADGLAEMKSDVQRKIEVEWELGSLSKEALQDTIKAHCGRIVDRLDQDMAFDAKAIGQSVSMSYGDDARRVLSVVNIPAAAIPALVNGQLIQVVAFIVATVALDVLLPLGLLTALFTKAILPDAFDLQKWLESGARNLCWRAVKDVFPDIEASLNKAARGGVVEVRQQVERAVGTAIDGQLNALEASYANERDDRQVHGLEVDTQVRSLLAVLDDFGTFGKDLSSHA